MNELEHALLAGDVGGCMSRLEHVDVARLNRPLSGEEVGMAAVHVAALAGNAQVVEMVLEKGVDVLLVDAKRRTPLHCAVESGSLEAVKAIVARLEEKKWTSKNVWLLDARKWTPLHLACAHLDILKFLEPFAESVEKIWHCTGLVRHAACRSYQCLQILLSRHLHKVGGNGNEELIEEEEEEKEKEIEKESEKALALNEAAKKSTNQHALDPAILNEKDTRGCSILVACVEKGDFQACKLLVQLGADTSLCDLEQQNALHYAAFLGHSDIFSWLSSICTEQSLCGKNVDGKTPQELIQDDDSDDSVDQDGLSSDPLQESSKQEQLETCTIINEVDVAAQPAFQTATSDSHQAESDSGLTKWQTEESKALALVSSTCFAGESSSDDDDDDDEASCVTYESLEDNESLFGEDSDDEKRDHIGEEQLFAE